MSPLAIFFLFLIHSSLAANTNIYNVQNYGAKSDGKTDSSKAFLSAWAAACASNTPATINVPSGKYLIHNANFNGQTCKSKAITIHIDGTLLAPSDYNVIGNDENWIKFEKVNGVSIYGGTFDGQGAALWACKNSNSKNCPDGTTVR
ncbi:polygalacturonase-like [Solanum stenotomum]|uniref:polygalacturonase-like n=1 Tax=Solanum stenotomum TaxID=172797 RepID=UPI0020CFF7F6|nr:polygalacturonase-like [Solanum stenotomum]